MKKYLNFGIFLYCIILFISCSDNGFLDQVPDDKPTLESTFTNKIKTEQFLAHVYTRIYDGAGERGNNTIWTCGSDEGDFQELKNDNTVHTGAVDANWGMAEWNWIDFYASIRTATTFLKNVDMCKELSPALLKQYKAEARALRAMYYYYLVQMYGPVVILNDELVNSSANFDNYERSPMDDCINYIVSELDAAATDLPPKPATARDYGRMNRPAALAYKLEALMLAASPLFNGGGGYGLSNAYYAELKNLDGSQLISQTYDKEKWKKVIVASEAFISEFVPTTFDLYKEYNEDGTLNPYLSCRNVVLNDWNKEWIWARIPCDIGAMQYTRTPRHDGANDEQRGDGQCGVTQTMVDAFFMNNGLTPIINRNSDGTPNISVTSLYKEDGYSDFQAPFDTKARKTRNAYVNREPRFYVGVTYTGSVWLNQNGFDVNNPLITNFEWGGNSSAANGSGYSPTGYCIRKNVKPGAFSDANRAFLWIRLTRIYLNYIEALYEYDPKNSTIVKYLNMIRERAGIPGYGVGKIPIPVDNSMREAIRKERRVELFTEGSRFWDTRRWLIAEQTDNGAFLGLSITESGESFFKLKVIHNRMFKKCHYLFPIHQLELTKAKNIVQNTGY